ncbi:TonB-dependent receptor [Aquimarina algiphila]|uniref:TonB-dependent receptor n=1 Tax=Aquimarina algiphila TaxID=2047982 RepID=A0A554VF10_9FLAO|nr:TonB-dependent receptor [Aquimarina algiphila]TSE05708.1 TonB-dependent receptor [Aquimarina algiphila]
MKRIFLLLILVCSFPAYSQLNVTGTVIDSSNNLPIENAKVLDVGSNVSILTDVNGKFSIKALGKIEFSKEGYAGVYILIDKDNYSKDKHIEITLFPITELTQVLIEDYFRPQPHKYATDAVSTITANDINRGNPIELHPVLNRVAGVFMQNGTLNTNRITIRGIGARNLFGTANIRAYFGDIPLTDGNGESSIEDLELGTVSQIEIHKGPSSSSFGVGLGGAILFKPEYAEENTTQSQLTTSFGSYGLRRILARASTSLKNSNIIVLYSNNHTDGYRENNEYDRNTITLASDFDLGEKDSFSILGSYVDLKAGIPSSLNQEDFDNNPRQAAFTWGRAQGFEDINYGILGLTWKHRFNEKISNNTSLFTSFRNNDEPRPFNILKENTNSFGIRSRILGTHLVAKKKLNWTIGGELFFENYTGKTFQNLYEDFPIGTGSVQGNQLSDLDEKRYYYNLFGEVNYEINKKLRFNAGAHLNQTSFDIEDQFLSDGEDNSGEFDFDPILSPKIGINYTLNYNVTFYGSIAHGFSTPTTSETLLPNGIFNPNIKPEIGWNYEIGTRYKLLDDRVYGSLSLYTLRARDLLVSRRTVDDNFFAINAGKTTHNGAEFELNFTVARLNLGKRTLNFFFNASIYDHTFDNFIDLDSNFSGNDLTGVPSEVTNSGIEFITEKGFYGNLNYQTVGKIPVNDANTTFSKNYELLHGKIGFKNSISNHFNYDLFLGVNNILDTDYASQLQINARGFGGNAPRYFYPGLPFNIYGGININYRL